MAMDCGLCCWPSRTGVDDGGPGKLTLSAALSDPFLNFLEDGGDVEGQMERRCRPHRDFRPALRELSLEDGQRQLGSDFGLSGEDRDHPRFKASFGLPHHALKGRTVRQFGRRLSIAATTDGMQDDGRSVIGELGLAALWSRLPGEVNDREILPSYHGSILAGLHGRPPRDVRSRAGSRAARFMYGDLSVECCVWLAPILSMP